MLTKQSRQFVLILLLLLLAACGSGSEEPATENDAAFETETAGDLVIYSGRSESLVQPIIDQFAAETGINVQVRYGSTSEMAGVLLEEGENSPADLFYAQDPGGLGAIANAGMFSTLPEATIALVPDRFTPDSNNWVGISGRARVVVYSTSLINDPAGELPADIFDFVGEEWNGRIGWAPTNGSFQAMVTAMRATWGNDKTREWLQGIQANNPVVYPKNTPIVAGVAAEEVAVGFVNHYYLHRFLAEEGEGFAARNYFLPGGGPGSLIMVSGAGILNTAPNAENAQRFIDFLLSVEAQQYFADETFEYPVVAGININPGLAAFADLDSVALSISMNDLADLEGTQDMLLALGIIE
ncbi:iron ABC transporter substrate-binding protein [Candidatus Leptofilum sp.]|uniref:iron ABC transporter substrate-binding protein n=1 Tax=Candidatus Leptofilum sp. TaxID=3241576 RepID=UPI003B5BCDF5